MFLDPAICVKRDITIPSVYTTGSTVDADSAAAQAVLNVTATTAFSATDNALGWRVVIGRGTAREEQGTVLSIQAAVSITLDANLTYEHTAVQADPVEVCMASLSIVLDKSHYKNMALYLPANWVTASITLAGCDTADGTFNKIVDSVAAAEVVVAEVTANLFVTFSGVTRNAIAAIPFIKLRSGTLAAQVDQSATVKTISVVMSR